MTTAPTLHSLVEEALAHIPALSRHLLEATQDELEKVPSYFPLLESWRRLRARFTLDFEAALVPMLQVAKRGGDPLQRSKPQSLDALGLVDERQALRDVAIAQVIHAIDDLCKAELHQLGNFFAALRGTARARKDDNPVRPALFAQALFDALAQANLDLESRYALMRAAAQPMSQGLLTVYRSLCRQLHDAELTELVASHAAKAEPSERRLRFASSVMLNEPATLDGLSRRVQAHNTASAGLAGLGTQAKSRVAPDMLSRLYDQILADPRLLPPVKTLLAKLQIPVVRLARLDASLLRREDHPTWQLLNRVAAHGMAFEHSEDERLRSFLQFMEGESQALLQASLPSAKLFEQLLHRVEAYISRQAHARSERSAAALEALEREQMRSSWIELLREQIDAQIAGTALGPLMQRFMRTVWVEVIAQAMVLHGKDSCEAQDRINVVDELLSSLLRPASAAQRAALLAAMPALARSLQAGCDSIALAPEKRDPALQELMQTHASLARGEQATVTAPRLATPADSARETSPEELLQQLLNERESQLPEQWARKQVDRSALPTVPLPLSGALSDQPSGLAAQATIKQWVSSMQVGCWFHMFIQSEWLTAQLAWVSESQQFFLFIGEDSEERHSLTLGAIEQLFANGLMAVLDERGLVQQAVSTLMQDLGDEV